MDYKGASHMPRFSRLALGAFATATCLLVARPVRAQVSCGTLPNPIIVTGPTDFEPLLQRFAVKIAAESAAATIITPSISALATSCAAVEGVVTGTKLGGLPGRYYTLSGMTTIATQTCLFTGEQTPHVAISNVFYEACSNVPQPKPADMADVAGPVQATVFVVPKVNTTVQYLTYDEARAIYGCGVSSALTVAGRYADPTIVSCRNPAAGTQVTLARNIGLPESVMIAPKCTSFINDGSLLFPLISRGEETSMTDDDYAPKPAAIGFVAAGEIDAYRAKVNPLAFQAPGQAQAYYPDSSPTAVDRRNVRDGHYPIWGYVHMIAKTAGGNLNPQAAELIGWINGTKASQNIDAVVLEASAGYIPQCAMKVKRTSDGGLLSPSSPAEPCHCGFEAFTSRTTPAGCIPCASNGACPCGSKCRHGFCE
jgi:ABC-type phosphate transport system substrate-binding protein